MERKSLWPDRCWLLLLLSLVSLWFTVFNFEHYEWLPAFAWCRPLKFLAVEEEIHMHVLRIFKIIQST